MPETFLGWIGFLLEKYAPLFLQGAGITMLIVVALLLGGAAALIGVRSHSLKRQLTA